MAGPKRVTQKQLAANRANAQRSTGPRTPEGKAAVRYNVPRAGLGHDLNGERAVC